MKKMCPVYLILAFLLIAFDGVAANNYVKNIFSNNFCVARPGVTASLLMDSSDYKGVLRAAADLQSDIQKVTGQKPALTYTSSSRQKYAIIIGTIGQSKLIDRLIASGKIKTGIKSQWEAFSIQVVKNPLPNIEQALVIAGSDKRGTIYGIYDLSEQIGVSPWYWWADVTPKKQNILAIASDFKKEDKPAVKYH